MQVEENQLTNEQVFQDRQYQVNMLVIFYSNVQLQEIKCFINQIVIRYYLITFFILAYENIFSLC